jgi:hypothetical protein
MIMLFLKSMFPPYTRYTRYTRYTADGYSYRVVAYRIERIVFTGLVPVTSVTSKDHPLLKSSIDPDRDVRPDPCVV